MSPAVRQALRQFLGLAQDPEEGAAKKKLRQ